MCLLNLRPKCGPRLGPTTPPAGDGLLPHRASGNRTSSPRSSQPPPPPAEGFSFGLCSLSAAAQVGAPAAECSGGPVGRGGAERSGAFGSGQDQRGSCRAPILPSARISLSTTDRGTTALLSSVAGGTTENKHLARAPRDVLRCDWATVIRARGEAGRGGSGTAGSRVEARRSFSCAFNELSNEVGASSEEGCGLDFYEIIPFLCAFSLWKYSGRSQQS